MDLICLIDAEPGMIGRIALMDLDSKDAALLRAMGLSPNVLVRVCRIGSPFILEIVKCEGCGCRIGLVKELARNIFLKKVYINNQ